MRGDDALKNIPVIVITANEMMGERSLLLDQGATGFIRKPFHLEEVYDKVAQALGVAYRYADESPAAADQPEQQNGSVPSVLVVDDNQAIQTLFKNQFKTLGIDVLLAENGERALDLWRQNPIDLIVTDCAMAVMDGYEMAAEIRKLEEANATEHRTVIIAVTGAAEENRERCLSSGMDDVLAKPFLFTQLEEVMARHFSAD